MASRAMFSSGSTIATVARVADSRGPLRIYDWGLEASLQAVWHDCAARGHDSTTVSAAVSMYRSGLPARHESGTAMKRPARRRAFGPSDAFLRCGGTLPPK